MAVWGRRPGSLPGAIAAGWSSPSRPHLAEPFTRGLEVARLLDTAGIRAGAPAPALSGAISVDTASGDRVALLTWVPGSPGADEAEQRLIGDTLARVHRVLRDREVPGARRFHWVDPAAAHLSLRPWIRPAVTTAVDELAALQRREPGWVQGLLHADRAPEAFRYDAATGVCGIIDWSSAHYGRCCTTWHLPSCTWADRTAPPR